VSTKVGFFPAGGTGERPAHSLEPTRLRDAIEQSAEDLGRCPDVVLLHNPERTLSELPTRAGGDCIVAVSSVLGDAVTNGLCGAWGIATWDPRSVVSAFNEDLPRVQPAVLLHRSGLSVPEPILQACEQLCQALHVPEERRWGMSPFGGEAADPAWRTTNMSVFLAQGQQFTNHQAAFRLAYELPAVTRVAVGTNNVRHLQDLVDATVLAVDEAAIQRYRELISRS
jgi:pyridoxine 4-dehydrogenase